MRQYRVTVLGVAVSFLVGVSGCVADSTKSASDTQAPSPMAQAEEGKDQPPAGEIQERSVRDRMQPGRLTPVAPAPLSTIPAQVAPAPAGPVMPPVTNQAPTSTLGTRYVGPTEDLTKIANALAWYHKSLTTLITVKPGLALTQPVTISIGYFSPAGYGPGSPERLTQSYVASSGNRFLRLDPEGDGHLRRVHLDITLSEPKPGGGVYSYNVPVDMDLDPLYDVAISPLQFSLLDTCNIVGDTEIDFYWYSPDAQPHKNTFHTVGGRDVTIGPFAWTHAEVGASANLHPPTFLFRTVNTLDFNDPAFGNFAPGLYPSKSNLVPGKTQTNKGNLTAQNENGCIAYVQYPSTYTLRWYADLDSPMVRDHR